MVTIPNTYHIPQLPMRLILSQHLAQELRPLESTPNGTYCLQLAKAAKLVWMDRKHTHTIPLSDKNVPIFCTAPSYTHLWDYESVQKLHKADLQAFLAHFIVPDDNDLVLTSSHETQQTNVSHNNVPAGEQATVTSGNSNNEPTSSNQETATPEPSKQTPDSSNEDQPEQQYVFDLTKEHNKALNNFKQDAVPTNMSPTKQQMQLWHY